MCDVFTIEAGCTKVFRNGYEYRIEFIPYPEFGPRLDWRFLDAAPTLRLRPEPWWQIWGLARDIYGKIFLLCGREEEWRGRRELVARLIDVESRCVEHIRRFVEEECERNMQEYDILAKHDLDDHSVALRRRALLVEHGIIKD